MKRQYLPDIENVEKRYDRTDTKIYGQRAKCWSLRIGSISSIGALFEIVVSGKVIGYFGPGNDRIKRPGDLWHNGKAETIMVGFLGSKGTEEGEVYYYPTTMQDAWRIIDELVNPAHWNNPSED